MNEGSINGGGMKSTVTFDDFMKLELRVGLVTNAQLPSWSHKLIELTVDFGADLGVRTILSGVQQWYTPADFLNKKFPFIVNLAERKMGEGVSQGMMLMADDQTSPETAPVLLAMPENVAVGSEIR